MRERVLFILHAPRTIRTLLIIGVLAAQCTASWAVYGVRISDLKHSPAPPNPIKVWGKVVSEAPLRLSDGRDQIEVAGIQARTDDFIVAVGDWSGSVLTVNGPVTAYIGPARTEMVYVAPGSFLMGNSGVGDDLLYDQQGFCPDEKPLHSVSMPGYWIANYEVTRGEYQAFMNAGGYTNSSYWSTAGWNWKLLKGRTKPDYWAEPQTWCTGKPFDQTGSHPVVGVSYHEAEAYCAWAGGRLPTEAEREKAARGAGSSLNIYPWGDHWDADKCNNLYDHNPAGGGYDRCQTAPVGNYPTGASPYGCQDMAGNVWETCKDWYEELYYSPAPPGGWDDPQGPASSSTGTRAVRGGGWVYASCGNSAICCRCGNRGKYYPDNGQNAIGIRLARS